MIRDPVAQIKLAEPAVYQVEMQLLAKTTLRSDAEAVSDQQDADQKFGIYRNAAHLDVKIRHVAAYATKIDKTIKGPKKVILRDMILERTLVDLKSVRCRLHKS